MRTCKGTQAQDEKRIKGHFDELLEQSDRFVEATVPLVHLRERERSR